MIIAIYKCGYCNSEFELSYFNSQEIPERNVGCTNCRIAGEKVKLIKKIRDERGVVDEHLFKRSKKTSSLLYPITVLEAERDDIHGLPKNRVDQLNKAIEILNDERYKIEKEEFKIEVDKQIKKYEPGYVENIKLSRKKKIKKE